MLIMIALLPYAPSRLLSLSVSLSLSLQLRGTSNDRRFEINEECFLGCAHAGGSLSLSIAISPAFIPATRI
jgi:hypothetical protein